MNQRMLCAAAIAATLLAAGCGADDEDAGTAPAGPGAAGAATETAGMAMTPLAATTKGDVRIGLESMAPETFFVSQGGAQRKHAPAPSDTAHMMVTLADAKSGVRLPDASVTLRLVGPGGKAVYDGPLYPMLGRGMGMHYGENVPLGAPGTYTAQLVAGPPRIGRHMDAAGAWSKTVRLQQRLRWDGKAVSKAT